MHTPSPAHATLLEVARRFELPAPPVEAVPLGSGHINLTFLVTSRLARAAFRHVLQRLNRTVFPFPGAVMENVSRVTAHLRTQLENEGVRDVSRRCLTLVPARDGQPFVTDSEGDVWRLYEEIPGGISLDSPDSADRAREAARAFAEFSRRLASLPPPALNETISRFHDTGHRFSTFLEAVRSDPLNRASTISGEISEFTRRENLSHVLPRAVHEDRLTTRVAHNDTKINNVLFDRTSRTAICVIDLDTVMPGLFLHDFGDLVRSAANPAREDDLLPSRAVVSTAIFAALLEGTLDGLGSPPALEERRLLVTSALVLTFELGLRFLTDYLTGDRYFRPRRPAQNLDRARVHLNLLRSMEERQDEMESLVERISAGSSFRSVIRKG